MTARIYDPDRLLDEYRDVRGGLSVESFFRAPGMSRVREMWCAAHFARAYARYLAPCQVRIDDEDDQNDYDFELRVGNLWHLFQVAEVMEPGRQRAAEYRDFIPGQTRQEDWSPGTEHGADWIRDAIARKAAKKYSRADKLNLLLYVNFPAYDQNYQRIRDRCSAKLGVFRSTWLLNGNALCCIQPHESLASCEGWLQIPESLAHDEP